MGHYVANEVIANTCHTYVGLKSLIPKSRWKPPKRKGVIPAVGRADSQRT